MGDVIDFANHKRTVDHELCRLCDHDETCSSVCIAVETLVQLCKVQNPLAQQRYIFNLGMQLDLDNSFTPHDA